MLKCKNIGISIKRNSKNLCLHDILRARTFRARRKFLQARYVHAYECTRNFLRPVVQKMFFLLKSVCF